MKDRLEEFVRDHREEFDTEEPDSKIWEKIRQDMEPGKKKPTPLVRMGSHWIKWTAAAAAVLILMVGTIWYFKAGRTNSQPDIAGQHSNTNPAATDPISARSGDNTRPGENTKPGDSAKTNPAALARTENPAIADSPTLAKIRPETTPDTKAELESSVNEEMYHYAKLVEIKHKELKTIEKDEPLLYKQFAIDVNKLDSVYRNLQAQLPKNPNREQLLEAMLQNLQLQMGLLNHQLDIIKQINHSKKTEYEKAYKTL